MISSTEVADWIKAAQTVAFPDATFVADSEEPDLPGPYVWVTPVFAPPATMDGLIDLRGYNVEVAGKQNDFDYAEQLAFAVDRQMLGDGGAVLIGGKRVIARYRAGGPPYSSQKDDGDRTHFVCGYLHEVESGV